MKLRLSPCGDEDRRLVEAFFSGELAGRAVRDTKARKVHCIRGGGRALYVKQFLERGLGDRLRSLVSDRAAREFRVLTRLSERGVPAARPVAHGRIDGVPFLVTEEIANSRELTTCLESPHLRALALLARAVHDAGVRNDDFHLGNVLMAPEGLHLVDVHRAELTRLSQQERAHGVAFLLLSLETRITPGRALAFIYDYRGGRDRAFAQRVWEAFQATRRAYWASRTSRCRKNGSEFAVEKGWCLRRPMSAAQAESISAQPGREVKRLRNRSLTVTGDRFVKRSPKAMSEWENSHGLEVRRLPTPQLYAARKGVIIGEWRGGALPLWEHIQTSWPQCDREARNGILYDLARLIRRLHVREVYHKDLKANNVLVEGGRFWLIDLDRVRLGSEVREPERFYNLAQLNAAVGAPLTRTDRLRFYRYYAGNNREWRRNWKRHVREVMRLTVERRHHWPPSRR